LEEKGNKAFADIKTFFSAYKSPIGIEVELEGFDQLGWPETAPVYWTKDEDGSLKDSGAEFISKPVAGKNIDYALYELERLLKAQKYLRWSHRCSIHVHTNVRNWTLPQLRTLVGVYAAMENLFFSLVAPHRRASAFCFPLTDTSPAGIEFGAMDGKYCALNLACSIQKYGTIEFRHMHGTSDIKTIRRWLQLIVKLHAYCRKNPVEQVVAEVLNLNTISNFVEFVQKVLGPTAVLFMGQNLQDFMQDGVMWAKMYYYDVELAKG
jgi:hypothetical protein